ncbi:MAG: efflux RND transporter periplasmic adaptor subunit [Alphaproteobacteria bacterium]
MVKTILQTIAALGLLAGSAAIFKLLLATQAIPQPEPPMEKYWMVETMQLERATIQPSITSYGTVQSNREIEIRSPVAGQILNVGGNLFNGSLLKKDELIVEVDPFQFQNNLENARAKLLETRAQIQEVLADIEGERAQIVSLKEEKELVQRTFDRALALQERGTQSQSALDKTKLDLTRAERTIIQKNQVVRRLEASVDKLEAIADQRKAALERAERDLQDTKIFAPNTGYVTNVRAAVGLEVSPNEKMAVLRPLDSMEIRFELSEADLGIILGYGTQQILPVGSPIKVIWRIGTKATEFFAELSRVEGLYDASTASVGLYATIKPDVVKALPAPLRPGAFVEVHMPGPILEDVFVIPQRALGPDKDIFEISKDGRITSKKVNYLFSQNGQAIVAGSLTEGTEIVTSRFPELGSGALVKAVQP